jgi:hypothetical protein
VKAERAHMRPATPAAEAHRIARAAWREWADWWVAKERAERATKNDGLAGPSRAPTDGE